MSWLYLAGVIVLLVILYVRSNDAKLKALPERAAALSRTRWTPALREDMATKVADGKDISIDDQIPPMTGRRYIVVGGAGFLGGWIVVQLLRRGEDPKRIRILDIRPPTRSDLLAGAAKDVAFFQIDIANKQAIHDAFHAPWPTSNTAPITVFHTAANIRFYERYNFLVPNSARVNVDGTQNIIDAVHDIGATALIYTSSGSIGVHSTFFFCWPWQKEPHRFVQVINDDDSLLPKSQDQFFSNYAYTKYLAEKRVRAANNTPGLRTGCLRPGNGIFGPGGDMLCGAYLVRKHNPTWISNILSSFTYAENCALAHLLYEARLIDTDPSMPDLGGQAFCVADPSPPPTYGDVYNLLEFLDGEVVFQHLSPTCMLVVAYIIEFIYVSRYLLPPFLSWLIPNIAGSDIVNLQPSLFNLVQVHLVFDDSRARLPPKEGGLGYRGAWTTFEGLYQTALEHKRGTNRSDQRSDMAGVSFGFGMVRAQRGIGWLGERMKKKIGLDPVEVLAK